MIYSDIFIFQESHSFFILFPKPAATSSGSATTAASSSGSATTSQPASNLNLSISDVGAYDFSNVILPIGENMTLGFNQTITQTASP
jgi:hypothetical protein